MKKTKLVLSAILLCAAVGAYASSHNLRQIQSYYVQGNSCVQFELVDCLEDGTGCIEETPDGLKQLYASPVAGPTLPCSEPLRPE